MINNHARLNRVFYILIVFLLLPLNTSAFASTIVSPVGISGTTLVNVAGSADHTIDQSGLSVGFTSGVTDFTTYVAGNPTHAFNGITNAWAVQSTPGYVDYDLGAIFKIDTFAFWGQSHNYSVNSFTLFSSNDAGFGNATNLGTFNALFFDPIPVQLFSVNTTARYMRFFINSNHGGSFTNFGEVAFEVSDVPEPATMALFGFGLLGIAGVNRRKK